MLTDMGDLITLGMMAEPNGMGLSWNEAQGIAERIASHLPIVATAAVAKERKRISEGLPDVVQVRFMVPGDIPRDYYEVDGILALLAPETPKEKR